MSTRKVKKGEPWRPDSAADHNVKARAADAYRRGLPFTPDRAHPIDPCRIWVKNSSGAARSMFECLELDDAIILNEVTAEQIFVDGIEPTDTGIPFAVLLQPAAVDGWRRGQVAGICPALVDVVDTDHTRAYLAAGEYVLTSSDTGPVAIVQKPDATGEQLCVVLFQSESEPSKLVELCAQETAERNVPYLCWKGEWDEEKLRYCYDAEEEVYAIDHRMGAPFAEEGWKGLYQKMPADYTHGYVALTEIWVCVSLDCELPPEGCACVDKE